MARHKRNKKNGDREEMQEDVSPSQMSQQDRELEVNTTGSAGSPEPSECFAFGVRMTMDRAANAHSSHSVSPNSAPPYDSQTQHWLHVQVTLKEDLGLNPLPKFAWTGSVVTDMFSKNEGLTEAVVLAPGHAVLFFGRQSWGEGLSYEGVQMLLSDCQEMLLW